jgi:predicted nucleic acid-binding protein
MIVVDTNVIGYLFLANERSDLAEQTLLRDADWVAPFLWRSELRNVLVTYVRKKLITLDSARQIMDEAEILMSEREYMVTSSRVLALASISNCSAYDCEFVAVAQDLHLPLVTADKKLLREFPQVAISLEIFCEE